MRVLSLAAVFVCFAAAVTARADSIGSDPKTDYIRVGHGSDPDKCGLPDFTIKLNGKGGGVKNCKNTSGQDWIGLDIFAVIGATDMIKCTGIFTCTFSESPSIFGSNFVDLELMLSGDTISAGSDFFINLNNLGTHGPSDPGGWLGADTGKNNGNLTVVPIVPEPSTILLVAAGLGILSARRRAKSLC